MPNQPDFKRTGAELNKESLLSSRLARRWRTLQLIGGALIIMSLFLSWERPDDVRLPTEGPFVLLIGVLVLMTGTLMGWWQDR